MAKQTGPDEIQAKMYEVKTLRARKLIHYIFEPGAPSWHETLPWSFYNFTNVAMAILYFTCEIIKLPWQRFVPRWRSTLKFRAKIKE